MPFLLSNTPINDEKLLNKALTHPSFTKEIDAKSLENYERLEFLGDAVLKLITSKLLYNKYPDYNEGKLSKIRSILVSDSILANVAKSINLPEYMIMSKAEEKTGGREKESNIACTMEAIFGAYYLDNKIDTVEKFIKNSIIPKSDEIIEHFEKYNAKAVLQEYTQKISNDLPIYKTIKTTGPQHDLNFEVEVSYNNKVLATGCGKTKKEAQQNSAYKACIALNIIEGLENE